MILDDIVRDKRLDLERARTTRPLEQLQALPLYAEPRRDFVRALSSHPRAIIGEIKKASPSKGVIRSEFEPVAIACGYAAAGAAALSVLTEERYFQGRLEYLAAVRAAVSLPLLRKDFLFDEYQLHEARAYGADAVLLIVAMLRDGTLGELLRHAEALGLAALVEVHDHAELSCATRYGARLVGINNRDLRTFRTTLSVTEDLLPFVPRDVLVVTESGIESPADLQRLERIGVTAFLIGETFMRAPDPGAKLAEFLDAPASRR
jgi:indole-3-glycerol phosphate synthase